MSVTTTYDGTYRSPIANPYVSTHERAFGTTNGFTFWGSDEYPDYTISYRTANFGTICATSFESDQCAYLSTLNVALVSAVTPTYNPTDHSAHQSHESSHPATICTAI